MKTKKYKVHTLSALALLVTSILLIGMNVPTGAQEPQPIYLHGPPLSPTHMHSNITLKPIHMHTKGLIDLSDPVCTWWSELYPNPWIDWHLASWEDVDGDQQLSPNDQIDMNHPLPDETNQTEWYHVDRITVTLLLSGPYPEPWHLPMEPMMAIEFKWPVYEPDVIYAPMGSLWHEVWSNYSNIYFLSDWLDDPMLQDGMLSFTDSIQLIDIITGEPTWWHVEDVGTDLILRWKMVEPVGTWWHELYPEYSKWYNLSSWEDTSEPFEVPSPGDQIDMTEEESENRIWYHVDRITITINVTNVDTAEWMMLELKTQYLEEMFYYLKYPIGSLWHEVYPNYSNVYNLTFWDPIDPYFDNCNGVLDPCDYIVLLNMTSPFPVENLYHIVDMNYDLILNRKITNPVCTNWHELYPECCVNDYHIDDWEDNGDQLLSPFDNVTMTLTPGVSTDEYHVKEVTLTLNLTIIDSVAGLFLPGDRIYVDFLGGYEWMYYPKTDPWYTDWQVVCPDEELFGYPLTIEYWDDNCNGVLSYCDYIELLGPGEDLWCHIDEVAVDIVVEKKVAAPVHDVAVIAVSSLLPQVDQGQVDPINVTVENQGDFPENVSVYAFYDGNLAAPEQTIPLNPGQNITLTFDWNTTGVPLGIYTISANATIIPTTIVDDDPLDNYLSNGTQEVIPEFPLAIILPLFMILSLITVVFKLKKKKQ